MPPASAATASACSSTACSSSASTTADSALPPPKGSPGPPPRASPACGRRGTPGRPRGRTRARRRRRSIRPLRRSLRSCSRAARCASWSLISQRRPRDVPGLSGRRSVLTRCRHHRPRCGSPASAPPQAQFLMGYPLATGRVWADADAHCARILSALRAFVRCALAALRGVSSITEGSGTGAAPPLAVVLGGVGYPGGCWLVGLLAPEVSTVANCADEVLSCNTNPARWLRSGWGSHAACRAHIPIVTPQCPRADSARRRSWRRSTGACARCPGFNCSTA